MIVASTPGFLLLGNSSVLSPAQVLTLLSMHSSPQSKPSGNCSSITEPGANGKFVMLRGSEMRTVLPFSSSMLAMVSESGRRPQRSAPESPPRSSTL